MKGLWLLPSRRRLEKLSIFFNKAIENGVSTPGVVLVQKDELTELKSQYDSLSIPSNWQIVATTSDGMGDKYREIWPAVKDLDWVGIGCDDLRPQTPGWDKTLLSHITGKNIVSCNDGKQGMNRMSGITVFSGPVLKAMGYIFPPFFWHTYVDNVWEDIGRQAQCWTYVDDVLVTHDHPFVNQQIDPSKADETTYKSYGKMQEDYQVYQQWIKNDRQASINRVALLTKGSLIV